MINGRLLRILKTVAAAVPIEKRDANRPFSHYVKEICGEDDYAYFLRHNPNMLIWCIGDVYNKIAQL